MSNSMMRISGDLVNSETAVLGQRRRRHKGEETNEFCKLCATLNTEPNRCRTVDTAINIPIEAAGEGPPLN